MKQSGIGLLVAVALVLAGIVPAAAEEDGEAGPSFGFRVGYGVDPDQFVIGGQADLGALYHNLRFVPSIDAGFGDDMTTIAFNGDIQLFVPLPQSSASFYGLVGPTVIYWDPEQGDGDTEIGLSLGLGLRLGLGETGWYNIEGRVGVGDIPDFRILLGLLFGGQ